MGQSVAPRRTLGDKLYFLRQLSEDDLRAIEQLVDYRIEVRCAEEFARIKTASKTLKFSARARHR